MFNRFPPILSRETMWNLGTEGLHRLLRSDIWVTFDIATCGHIKWGRRVIFPHSCLEFHTWVAKCLIRLKCPDLDESGSRSLMQRTKLPYTSKWFTPNVSPPRGNSFSAPFRVALVRELAVATISSGERVYRLQIRVRLPRYAITCCVGLLQAVSRASVCAPCDIVFRTRAPPPFLSLQPCAGVPVVWSTAGNMCRLIQRRICLVGVC